MSERDMVTEYPARMHQFRETVPIIFDFVSLFFCNVYADEYPK
jgi:hypothetical protein